MRIPASVLFVCIGNSCRSQMAEGFARARYDDLMEAASAGVQPAAIVQPKTIAVMERAGCLARRAIPREALRTRMFIDRSGREHERPADSRSDAGLHGA